MFLQVLSADIPYADIAFFVILALGLLLGILRGFSKSFKGFFLTIGIMLAALLILSPTFAKVREISVFQKMETSITQGIEKKSELLSQPIYVVTDEEGNRTFFVDVTQDGVTERVNLETVIANSDMSGALKGKITLWLAQKFIYKDGQSIGAVAGIFISDIVVAIVAYIAYCLALGLICWLLRKIFAKMHDSDNKLLKALDRTCGAIVSTAFAAVFILLMLAILYALREKIEVVDNALRQSKVCGYFYLNNPVAKLLTEIFG